MKTNRKKARSRGAAALLQSLGELEAAMRDGATARDLPVRFASRRRVIVPVPGEYGPDEIKLLREKLNVSQGDFAELLGISRILVQSWEQGVRTPSALARRLLDGINDDPAAWIAGLRRHASRSGRRRAG
jgi:DNA-binding transcriptional regulator YiaG